MVSCGVKEIVENTIDIVKLPESEDSNGFDIIIQQTRTRMLASERCEFRFQNRKLALSSVEMQFFEWFYIFLPKLLFQI